MANSSQNVANLFGVFFIILFARIGGTISDFVISEKIRKYVHKTLKKKVSSFL